MAGLSESLTRGDRHTQARICPPHLQDFLRVRSVARWGARWRLGYLLFFWVICSFFGLSAVVFSGASWYSCVVGWEVLPSPAGSLGRGALFQWVGCRLAGGPARFGGGGGACRVRVAAFAPPLLPGAALPSPPSPVPSRFFPGALGRGRVWWGGGVFYGVQFLHANRQHHHWQYRT